MNRIENEAHHILEFEQNLNGRNLLCLGKQLLSNERIWNVIKNIVKPFDAREVRKHLGRSFFHAAYYKQFLESKAIHENFEEFRNSWTNYD